MEELYHAHMERDFPDDELKPLFLLEELAAQGINRIYGCYKDGRLAGYYVLARKQGSQMVLLDYLAVVPEWRGTGVGSHILRMIREQLEDKTYLFIESENPAYAKDEVEKVTRERRLDFYRRGGAVEQGVKVLLFGVQYNGLTLSRDTFPTPQQQMEDYMDLYRSMLPPDWYEKNVAVRLENEEQRK